MGNPLTFLTNLSNKLNRIKTEKVGQQLEKAEKTTKDLSRLKITDLNPQKIFFGLFNNKDARLANQIRSARNARSQASHEAIKFMQANPELGRVLKSGNRGFSSPEAIAGINAARLKAFKDSGYGLTLEDYVLNGSKKVGNVIKDLITGNNRLRRAEKAFNAKHPILRIPKDILKYGTLGSGITLGYSALNGTGWTNTLLDFVGNNTRKDDGTPLFTVNRDFDNMSSNAQAFLQDAIDKKVIPGKWSTPEEREKYFQEHPTDTIRTGWYGRLNKNLQKQGITQSDYKKYYGIDYGSLGSMPGFTGFGINIANGKDGKLKRFDPVIAGLYETQQSMGSFPLAYVKDGVLTNGESWDYKKADKNAAYTSLSPSSVLRVFAGRHGTNETDSVPVIVTSNMKIPYKKRK